MNPRSLVVLLVAALCPTAALAADFPGPIKVTFRTVDCAGAAGLASVDVDRITRLQPYDCPNGRKLKQVLTRAGVGEVFTVSEDESAKLEAQIERVMASRQKALEQSRPIIIDR